MSTTPYQVDLSTLSDADVDRVAGGRQISPLKAQIGIMLLNGVLDPMWEIVGKTGHLPTPEELL